AARDHNDLVTLSLVPRNALHCLGAQDIWQIVLGEGLASRLNCCGRHAAISEADNNSTYQDARYEPELVAQDEGRKHEVAEKQAATADRLAHEVRHGLVGSDCAVEVKECERHCLGR